MSDPPKDIHRRRETSPLVAVLAPKPRPPPFHGKPQPSHTGSTPQALLGRSLLLRLQSDEKLVTLTRRGHPGAFDALVHRYHARLHAFTPSAGTCSAPMRTPRTCSRRSSPRPTTGDPRRRPPDQRAAVALPHRPQPVAQPPAPPSARRPGLHGRLRARRRRDRGRRGPPARGLPAPDHRRPAASRDAAHRPAHARDGRDDLRADRRGDGDHGGGHQVAAGAGAARARRGRRGADAVLRRGSA
jgi:hypothetical protein